MSIATLKIGNRKFVVVPERDYARLSEESLQYRQQRSEDQKDLAIIRQRAKDAIKPYSSLRKELGL